MIYFSQRFAALLNILACSTVYSVIFLSLLGCASNMTSANNSSARFKVDIPEDIAAQQSLIKEMADWQLLSHKQIIVDDWSGTIAPFSDQQAPSTIELISAQLINAPVEQVLYTLARSANLSLHINQPLTGLVTLLAEEQPLETLLSQVALQVPIVWEIEDGVLHLWGNATYTDSYPINYLNIDRSTRSRVGLATQVGTINSSVQQAGSGVSNSSQTSLENKADHVFWDSLATDMNILVSPKNFTINRDAGLLTVHAPRNLHIKIKRYLEQLNKNAQRQVLIEATVVEVALSKKFEAGIDWQFLSNAESGISAAQILSGSAQVNANTVDRLSAPSGLLSLVQKSQLGTLTGTLNLLDRFGDVRILSKPRIIALNNQTSVLKVVDNRVYFTVNVERQRSENQDDVITETEIHTVPVGLVMNVTPQINGAGEVMLNVRPTLSRILGFVDDPNPELASANVRNSVPEIQVREMESMLRVKSGEMAIIGGLMQDVQNGGDRGVPGLASLPVLGALFQQRSQSREQTELLIVLKPTVLPAASETPLAYN